MSTLTPINAYPVSEQQSEYVYKKTLGVGYEYPGQPSSAELLLSFPYIFNYQIIPNNIPSRAPNLYASSYVTGNISGGIKWTTDDSYVVFYKYLPLNGNINNAYTAFVYDTDQSYNLTTQSIPSTYDPTFKSYQIYVYVHTYGDTTYGNNTFQSIPSTNNTMSWIFDNATGCLTFTTNTWNSVYNNDAGYDDFPYISFYRYEGPFGVNSTQWTSSGSNIYYNTGNVGIGTTNPTYTLDVSGNTTFNSFPVCSDASSPSENSQLVNKLYVDEAISQGGGGTLLSSQNTWTGTNSFNTSLPTSTITASSANQLVNYTTLTDQGYTTLELVQSNNNAFTGTNTFNSFPVCSDANSPSENSQLVNKLYVDEAISQGGGGALLSSQNTWTGTSNTFTTNTYLASTSGNVGIGITNPNYTLDVSGNINIKNVSNLNTYAFICAGNNSFLGILAEATIGGTYNNIVQHNDTAIIVNTGSISGTGGLCLGVWNGTAGIRIDETKITMNGNVTATAFISNSDYRVKENIEPLDYTFNVDNLKPVKYNLKSSKELSTGFIAHELQEEFPFLVHGEKDGKDIQAINYSGLISILVKEIQDLKKEVSNMKDELFKLRK